MYVILLQCTFNPDYSPSCFVIFCYSNVQILIPKFVTHLIFLLLHLRIWQIFILRANGKVYDFNEHPSVASSPAHSHPTSPTIDDQW